MKPKRPTETDLLALVQNGFNAQLPKDRAAQAPAPAPAAPPKTDDNQTPDSVPFVLMVRITVAIQEDLRYRLKMAMMNQRRRNRSRVTQDEYCAKAIAAQLDLDEGGTDPRHQVAQLTTFLADCMRDGALAKGWVPKAQALLASIATVGR